jgi:hypothetical protein
MYVPIRNDRQGNHGLKWLTTIGWRGTDLTEAQRLSK